MSAVDDPTAAIELQPGERVLWQGRPGFGVSPFERRRILQGWWIAWLTLFGALGGCMLCVVLGSGRGGRGPDPLVLLAVSLGVALLYTLIPTVWIALAVYLNKLAGGGAFNASVLLLLGPVLGLIWIRELSRGGADAGLALFGEPWFVLAVLVLTVAVGRLVAAVLQRKHTRYVVTNRRAFEVRGERVVWETPLSREQLALRAVRPFGERKRGHIAIGFGRQRRLLRFLDFPDQVLLDLKRVLADLGPAIPSDPETPAIGPPPPESEAPSEPPAA